MYKIKNIVPALQGKKGQVNVEFILAVLLLSFVIVTTVIFVIRLLPAFGTGLEESNLRANALALEKILLEEPGVPINWTTSPALFGLAAANNHSNETIRGALDPIKLEYINSTPSANYGTLISNLSINGTVEFYLIVSSTWGYMEYFNYTPAKTENVIAFRKLMAINGSEANVTLLVW